MIPLEVMQMLRTLATAAVVAARIPPGTIVMWSGLKANIPAGWVLCDGTSGTPDLRERFIKSIGTDPGEEPGTTGGSALHTPAGTIGSAGSHDHSFTASSNAASPDLLAADTTGAGVAASGTTGSAGDHTHTFTGTEANFEPPFYKLAFIMRLDY